MSEAAPRLEYLRVLWTHDWPDTPVEMFYEISGGAVPRMVENFADGRSLFNTVELEVKHHPFFGESLVEGDMPTFAEAQKLTEDAPEFRNCACSAEEFEAAFAAATPKYEPAAVR